jgi:1-phosphofructokinase
VSTAARSAPPAIRVNLTITEPDGTTTKLNAPADPASPSCSPSWPRPSSPPRNGRLGRARRLAPAGRPGRLVRRAGRRAARTPAKVAVDTSDEPLAALVAGLARAAPHLMKPNAEELASFTGADADELEAPPPRPPSPPGARRPRRRARCSPPSAEPAPSSSPPRAPGTPLPRRRRSSAPSAPATPACSATSSATERDSLQPTGSPSPWPTAAPPPASRHDHPHPVAGPPELVSVRSLDLTEGTAR